MRRQRNRWHRGLWETLWAHRDMLFNPRYGRLGFIAVPYFLFFEALGPVVEMLGYTVLILGFFLHILFVQFALMFLALSVLYGMLLSQMAVGIETLLLSRFPRLRDRVLLVGAAFLEFVGLQADPHLRAVPRYLSDQQEAGAVGGDDDVGHRPRRPS